VTLDQWHIAITAALWVVGFFVIALTLPIVGPIRRISYMLALPIWAGWSTLYVYVLATGTFEQGQRLSPLAIGLRVLIFGIALEGILVPFTDRLELRHRPQEIRIDPDKP
jgi:uncharacterized RDD family membrane protein YckC